MRTLIFCLLATAACAGASGSPAEDRAKAPNAAAVPAGKWGGEHVVLEASDAGATVQLDCAHGAIGGPLTIDEKGGFDLSGDFVKEHGGPIRKDETENRRPARYRGRVEGATMTLTIDVQGDGEAIGPFTLERGSDGHVVRCR